MEHHPTKEVKLEVTSGSTEAVRIIKISGPLSIHNFFEFQDLARQKTGAPILIVDLTDVPYIDSAALGSFVGIHVSFETSGRKYALVNVNDRLQKLFAMTSVNRFLIIHDSIDTAESALLA